MIRRLKAGLAVVGLFLAAILVNGLFRNGVRLARLGWHCDLLRDSRCCLLGMAVRIDEARPIGPDGQHRQMIDFKSLHSVSACLRPRGPSYCGDETPKRFVFGVLGGAGRHHLGCLADRSAPLPRYV